MIAIIIPKQQEKTDQPINLGQALILVVAILSLIYSIKSAMYSFSVLTVVMFVIGISTLIHFIRSQKGATTPMIDLELFKHPVISTSIVMAVVSMIALVGFELLLSQELQFVHGFSPLQAAMFIIPFMIAISLGGPLAGIQEFYFLEVNTRLQVEHGVTEQVFGVDLVEWMVTLASGDWLAPTEKLEPTGHSIQVRLYAEDPVKQFQPSAGLLTHVKFDPQARVETWVETGSTVSSFYDPMIAKIIVTAATRDQAIQAMSASLANTQVAGIETNLEYLQNIRFTGDHVGDAGGNGGSSCLNSAPA